MRILLVLLLASAAPAAEPFPFFEPVKPPRPVQVMVHRGLHQRAPENTKPALDGCVADFLEWAEIDVRLTKDGRHVICHDETLERTIDGKGKVSEHTLEELKQLDAGSWFAPRFRGERLLSLAEVLEACKGRLNLYLDCKQIDPELLAREVIAARMEDQVVVYDRPEVLARVRTASGGRLALMTKYRPKFDLDTFLKENPLAAIEIDAEDVTPELCREFHRRGIKVQAKVLGAKWDRPEVWARMIDAGIDWAQTDDPVGFLFFAYRKRVARPPVRIAFHRGANRYAPENTLASLREAARLGADYIEFDIRTSKDGGFFLLHDRTLDRTTDGKGPLAEAASADLVKYDAGRWFGKPFAGSRLPTLDEALEALGPKSHAYLDAKDIAPEALLAAMKKHDLLERSVVYQGPAYLERLKKLNPAARLLPPLKNADDLEKVATLAPYGVDASWNALSKELIEKCHARNIRVFSDALGFHETVEDYTRAIGWGIDVIQTDYPARVLRALELLEAKK
jgi:glycerophosphoryl diester phosphodiesterase